MIPLELLIDQNLEQNINLEKGAKLIVNQYRLTKYMELSDIKVIIQYLAVKKH